MSNFCKGAGNWHITDGDFDPKALHGRGGTATKCGMVVASRPKDAKTDDESTCADCASPDAHKVTKLRDLSKRNA